MITMPRPLIPATTTQGRILSHPRSLCGDGSTGGPRCACGVGAGSIGTALCYHKHSCLSSAAARWRWEGAGLLGRGTGALITPTSAVVAGASGGSSGVAPATPISPAVWDRSCPWLLRKFRVVTASSRLAAWRPLIRSGAASTVWA